jgi:nucleoid-associated protein YgaU
MSHFEKVGVIFITGLVAIILALSLFGSGKQESESGLAMQDARGPAARELAPPSKPARSSDRVADAKAKRSAEKRNDDLWNVVSDCTPPKPDDSALSASGDVTPVEPPSTIAKSPSDLRGSDAGVAADVASGGTKKPADPVDGSAATSAKGETEHVIAAGENYYSLARRYYHDPSKWQLIAKANKVPSERLRAGMKITIPPLPSKGAPPADAKSTAPPASGAGDSLAASPKKGADATSDASAKSAKKPAGDADAAAHSYKVKKGDTLSQIAQSQLGSVKLLAKLEDANHDVLDGHGLREGMTLRIPAVRQ